MCTWYLWAHDKDLDQLFFLLYVFEDEVVLNHCLIRACWPLAGLPEVCPIRRQWTLREGDLQRQKLKPLVSELIEGLSELWITAFVSVWGDYASPQLHTSSCMCVAVRQMTAAVYQWLRGQRSAPELGNSPSTSPCLTSRTPPQVCALFLMRDCHCTWLDCNMLNGLS